jgi:acyl carrier protein
MKDAIRSFIADRLLNQPGGGIADDEDLLGTGLVDSVGMMSLVLFVESEFDVSVPPEDVIVENFLSISTIETYLQTRRQ